MINTRYNELISFEEYEKIVKSYSKPVYIPLSCTIKPVDADPASVYATLSPDQGFLLESMEGVPRRAVRSVIGIHPMAVIALSEITDITGEEAELFKLLINNGKDSGLPLEILERVISGISSYCPTGLSYAGGFTGYCRYDLITEITGGMVRAHAESGPVIRFMIPGEIIVFDHVRDTLTIIAGRVIGPEDDIKAKYLDAVKEIENIRSEISCIKPESVTCVEKESYEFNKDIPADQHEYENAVKRAQEHIRAGDIFQVVLSRKVSVPYSGDPFNIYRVLRRINPSPYLYCLNFEDEAVIGSSPEMLVKAEGEVITTVPIAGTRPRGKNQEEDERLAEALCSDPKEKAEHLMLVDLARNDIGKISEFGTVKVSSFMEVEKFSHVQHLTSVVTGELKKGYSRVDILKACFPAGTVSGAPKIRAMQIINDLESSPRGLYAGAVGYIGFDGLMEFAITIRTVMVKNKMATIQAGAGIVADSVPSREFEETEAKAQAMVRAVYVAGGIT